MATDLAGRARKLTARVRWGRPTGADVTAGMVTGLFSIPEGMAYASIAGFNPVAGLYAGVVPPILGSLTAPTVLMVTTLTSAIALTGQSVVADAGLDPHAGGTVAALTLLVGVVMLLMGALRLGVVLSFVSNAVMTGFSTGIALQIVTGVLGDASGYQPPGHNKLLQLWNWLTGIGHWQLAPTLVAAATIAVWALARTVRRLEPVALLVAMVLVSIAVALLGTDVELVRGIARIPGSLPGLSLPDWSAMPHLIGGALSVALVALAQAAGVSPSMPNPDGSRSNVNGDFAAQGLANLGGGLFQALPSGGSLSRTGVAASAGARTCWAGVISGVFLALVVLVAGKLAERIPMPVIGGLILVVGGELIWGKRADIALVLHTSALSTAAMAVTFAATTQLPLQQAIVIGAVLSLLLYCVQAARQSGLATLERDHEGAWATTGDPPPAVLPPDASPSWSTGEPACSPNSPPGDPTAPRRRRPRGRPDPGDAHRPGRPVLRHAQADPPLREQLARPGRTPRPRRCPTGPGHPPRPHRNHRPTRRQRRRPHRTRPAGAPRPRGGASPGVDRHSVKGPRSSRRSGGSRGRGRQPRRLAALRTRRVRPRSARRPNAAGEVTSGDVVTVRWNQSEAVSSSSSAQGSSRAMVLSRVHSRRRRTRNARSPMTSAVLPAQAGNPGPVSCAAARRSRCWFTAASATDWSSSRRTVASSSASSASATLSSARRYWA